ncbi:MAG: chromosome segregation protein SMC [Methanosarcinaceae archaeon]|nr:chromosome segregation protein SMC [Methanosarcinaceae archaeon]
MIIKEIEFVNFKSFSKKVKIPFYEGFTAISGPNGSGKSNIIDGVLFSLGLTGSKSMRAEKLTDLIYRPNDDKEKKPDFAEVIITFDNTDRAAPIDLDYFTISRKVKQTKSGYYSYYYLNGKTSSLTEIHDFLAKAGVTVEGYNVVMQGDVSQIMGRMSSIDRRKVIDDIAGVSEFEDKKQKSFDELDIVKEQIDKVDIIIEEVKFRLKRLLNERNTALKYNSLREEKRKYEGYLLLAKLKDAEIEIKNVENELLLFEEKKIKEDEKIKAFQIKVEEAEEEFEQINKDIREKGEDEQIRIKKEIEEIRGKITVYKETIEVIKRERESYDSRRRDLFLKIDTDKKELNLIEEKLSEEKTREDGLLREKEERVKEKTIVSINIARMSERFSEQANVLNEEKRNLESIKNKKAQIIRDEDRLLDSLRRKANEIREITAETEDSKQKASTAQSDIKVVVYEIESLQKESKGLTNDISDLESALSRLQKDMTETDNSIRIAETEHSKIEARVRAGETGSAYSHAVEDVLKASKRDELFGICGTVANLGRVNSKYATALEIAAGARMQAIVVETDSDAAHAINYLKNRGRGRATFIPLNKMESRRFLQNPDIPGFIGYAIDLTEYENKYDSAFWYVFRDTVIVDNLTNARKSIGKYRIVTLDGEVLEKSGVMVGGSISKRGGISFADTEKKKLEELTAEIRNLYVKREELKYKTEDVLGKIKVAEKRVQTIRSEIEHKNMVIEEIKGREDRLEELLRNKRNVISNLENENKIMKDELTSLYEIKKETEQMQLNSEEIIQNIESELNNPELEELNKKSQRIDEEIKRLESRINDVKAEINAFELKAQNLKSSIEDSRKMIEEADLKKDEGNVRIKDLEKQIELSEEKMRENEILESKMAEDLKALQDKRVEIDKKRLDLIRKLDKVILDREELDEKEKGCNLTHETLQKQVESLKYEISEKGISASDDVPEYKTVYVTIEALEKEMASMEPVNMRAIDEYDEVNKRAVELTERRDILFTEREQLLKRIDQFEIMKKNAFMEAYEAINKNFGEVFYELADGTGELFLENPDDPFSGGMTLNAQPKGKNIIRLESMSGGEKSLTALAFLIAIQVYRPAPFYVFDEVDQNLDGWNVERVANRIQKSSKDAQFVVISLRKPMLEKSDRIVGVTQQNGKTQITGIKVK